MQKSTKKEDDWVDEQSSENRFRTINSDISSKDELPSIFKEETIPSTAGTKGKIPVTRGVSLYTEEDVKVRGKNQKIKNGLVFESLEAHVNQINEGQRKL